MSKFDDLYNNYIINFGGGGIWVADICMCCIGSFMVNSSYEIYNKNVHSTVKFNMCLLIEVFGKYGL